MNVEGNLPLTTRTWRDPARIASLLAGLLLVMPAAALGATGAMLKPARSHEPTLVSVRLLPSEVRLWGSEASQQLVMLGKFSDGLERDITSKSRFKVLPPAVARIDEAAKVHSLKDGRTFLMAEVEGKTIFTTLTVQTSQKKRPFSFHRDIGSIFTRRGCNRSECHGGIKGKGGFKLSLHALHPREDYQWTVEGGVYEVLTLESEHPKIPRINLEEPGKSLLLLKPTMQVNHGGELRFDTDSDDYTTILKWIRSGAPYGQEGEKEDVTVERVEALPREVVLDLEGMQQLLVMAYLSDGRYEDVSREVEYISKDPDVVMVTEDGEVAAVGKGETTVMIRAAGHAVNVGIGVVDEFIKDYPDTARRNFIDDYVFRKLRKLSIMPSPLSDDAEFLRRVCLDIIGTLPPAHRAREFLADEDPHKRDKLIEILLNSPEYVDYWTYRFSDLFRVVQEPFYSQLYWEWIRESIAENKPYDQMARERLAAQGRDRPSRHYYENNSQAERVLAEELRVFTGRRFDCAECHNHPFEKWSQDQFWGLAAFYGNVDYIGYYDIMFDNPVGGYGDKGKVGPLMHPRRKEIVYPTFLDGEQLPVEKRLDPRTEFAQWLASHPYFAEAMANRMWGYFFNKGIVDPVDDFRAHNPATHPDLLDALARYFRDNGHDLKKLIRVIVQSRTYQLSSQSNQTNREDFINYSHVVPRSLDAEVLLDAISQVSGVPEVFYDNAETRGGQPPPGTRAINLKSPVRYKSSFLDMYGRPMRYAVPERDSSPSLEQALHLYAGTTYTTKLMREEGWLDRVLADGASDEKIIEELYLMALSRFPSAEEQAALQSELTTMKASSRKQALADLLWAVVTSREFTHNH